VSADADAVADAVAAAAPLSALSHLPEAERALAARLLAAALAPDASSPLPPAASPDEPNTPEGSVEGSARVLLDAKGKKAATLRSYEPTLGLGMALCRLGALDTGQALTLKGGEGQESSPALVPWRPSWWPDDVGTGSG
jgi:hypothetical protein